MTIAAGSRPLLGAAQRRRSGHMLRRGKAVAARITSERLGLLGIARAVAVSAVFWASVVLVGVAMWR